MKTTAQRQAAYRQRRPEAGDNGERRLNTWISTASALALKRLAQRDGVSQRAMLEKLIIDADDQVLSDIHDDAQWAEYFGVTQ